MMDKDKDDLAALLTRITEDNRHAEKFPIPAGKETASLSIPDEVEALIGQAQISERAVKPRPSGRGYKAQAHSASCNMQQ